MCGWPTEEVIGLAYGVTSYSAADAAVDDAIEVRSSLGLAWIIWGELSAKQVEQDFPDQA